MVRPLSDEILVSNSGDIPGGTVSINRKVEPNIAFVRGHGAYLWDADGHRYIDYHAAFGPYLLGHNAPVVEEAVQQVYRDGWTLTGSGPTPWEGRAAQLLRRCVPNLDLVEFTNTGSEATYLALRLARAATGRDHVIVMQGGYNGWHDYVAYNVMTPLSQVGPMTTQGEYPHAPLTSGMASVVGPTVHVVEFNSLEAIRWVMERFPVAAVITEPILQNIGVVKPGPGYLQGIQDLCREFGSVFIADEVKTGFRHSLSGYCALERVQPDLQVFGKAIANGYPVGAIGGTAALMELITHPDPKQRVMISGTYNGHPIAMAAAIATMEHLLEQETTLYPRLQSLTRVLTDGIAEIGREQGVPLCVASQGSALCTYFMDHAPTSWHDLAEHHDMDLDLRMRREMIECGSYFFPLPTKQVSVSASHTSEDVTETLAHFRMALKNSGQV